MTEMNLNYQEKENGEDVALTLEINNERILSMEMNRPKFIDMTKAVFKVFSNAGFSKMFEVFNQNLSFNQNIPFPGMEMPFSDETHTPVTLEVWIEIQNTYEGYCLQ
jgi:hypothetical protein